MIIYINRETCERLNFGYEKCEKNLLITPFELINAHIGSYDRKHMDFFKKFGLDREMELSLLRFGWFSVCN